MAQTTLTANQIRKGWDFKLREQARPRDIFGLKRGVYRDGQKVTDSFMVTKTAEPGEVTKTISMLKDLVGAGRTGADGLLGYEESQNTFEMRIFADELKHGVPYEKYGYNAKKKDPYGFIKMIQPQLSDWNAKQDGKRIREALAQGFDSVTASGGQSGISASYMYPHSNIFVTGVAASSQPAFSSTIATYSASVNTAVGSIAHPSDLSFLDEIVEWAGMRTLQGINGADAEQLFFLTIPSRTMTKIYKLLAATQQYTSADDALKGKGGRVYRNLVLVEDMKSPRVAVTSSTMTFSYYGVTDGRAAAASATPDVGYLLGAEALVEYVMEALHFEEEKQNYGQVIGVGSFCTKGFNRVDWEPDSSVTNGLSSSRVNYSSALVLFKSN